MGARDSDASALRFRFGEADVRGLRIREEARGHQAAGGCARFAREVVANNAKIIHGRVRELRASGTFADCPHIGGSSLEALVDLEPAFRGNGNASQFRGDAGSVGHATGGDEDIKAAEGSFPLGRAEVEADFRSRAACDLKQLSVRYDVDPLQDKQSLQLFGDIGIFVDEQAR